MLSPRLFRNSRMAYDKRLEAELNSTRQDVANRNPFDPSATSILPHRSSLPEIITQTPQIAINNQFIGFEKESTSKRTHRVMDNDTMRRKLK